MNSRRVAPRMLIAIFFFVTLQTSYGSNCKSQKSHLTINTHYNATGHWLATLKLEQKKSADATPGPLAIDVEPRNLRCDGVRTDALLVTFHGLSPPSRSNYEHKAGFGYYKMHESSVTWEEAKVACEKEDAHLLVLNSEREARAVSEIITRHPKVNSWVHVGFHDKEKEGHYITIFGQTLTEAGYATWNVNQPDNAGRNENCGSIWAPTMGLNDLPCTHKTSFICEQIP